ncbi:MAG: tetratricopeptide repeat protein [Actinobacteria bacterium]|nr:tetratricopeptide repeat protein [Actinomycetota bacterium]
MATRTFLFTDLEGSTRLWETHPEATRVALAEHDETLAKAITAHRGRVFKHTGDGVLAVFASASDAVAAAAQAQEAIASRPHPEIGVLRVRMAINTGEAEPRGDDFFGPALNRAARLLAAGHGGQILVGLVTERLAGQQLPDGLWFVDLGEHRIRDLARPERVFQLAGRGLPSEFPPLVTLDEIPNNLPTLATSFVGRVQELAEVEKLVRGARLVTVTGVGGAGKTRLALQVAASMSTKFPGGTWLVELAAVSDPDLIVSAIMGTLGVAEQPGRPLLDSLIEHLAHQNTLLIIDNCEHLIGSCARLVDTLLVGTTDLRIIATSRELLGIGGEVAYGLRSMSLPPDTGDLTARDLARYDAIRLFVERAAVSKTDFRLTAENAPPVVEICTRLDGMPLALELAAARIRSFTPNEVAEHLDRRFRLLTGGSRTALPRQQTLAAAIDWSYQLLEPAERDLFERLSVFQGGFTLGAAERVCADDTIDAFDVMELIPSLVDKSLVAADTTGTVSRYALLETIRQFARDLLDEHGRADEFRLRHAEYFVELAEAAEPHMRGVDERLWWGRIEADLDNLRQAMLWSTESDHAELGLRIAGAIGAYWRIAFRFDEGLRWLRATLASASADTPKHLLAKGHLGQGTLAGLAGLWDEEREHLVASLALYRQLDAEGADPDLLRQGYSAALINLSSLFDSEPERIIELNQEALEVARRCGNPAGVTASLGNIAEAHAMLGDLEKARAGFEESIASSERFGSTHRLVEAFGQLGLVELNAGEPERAEAVLRRALTQAEAGGLKEYAAFVRTQIAMARHDAGVPGMRAEFAAQAGVALQNEDFRRVLLFLAGWLIQRADLDLAEGDVDAAADLIGASLALSKAGTPPYWTVERRRDRVLARLKAILGEAAVEAAMARSAAPTVDELWSLVTATTPVDGV